MNTPTMSDGLWPAAAKRPIAVLLDTLLILAVTWLTFSFRYEALHRPVGMQWAAYALGPLLAVPLFSYFGLYRAVFRHSGLQALVSLTKAVALYGLAYALVLVVARLPDVPRTVGVLQPLLVLMVAGGWRTVIRVWFVRGGRAARAAREQVLIYGAGSAGTRLLAALQNSHEMKVVGFLDDDPRMQRRLINGVPIFGLDEVQRVVERKRVATVLLAIPSLSRKRRNEILDSLRASGVHVRTLPGLVELAQGSVRATDLRELDIEDLLGRDPVQPRSALMARHTSGKVVLVTGAGGSIGSELCRQLAALHPDRLVLVEQSEYALYAVHQELGARMAEGAWPSFHLEPVLCSVRDAARMREVFTRHRPHIVYHAAAYKHVPLVEQNVVEGVANNVLGTYVTAQAAQQAGVAEFVLISTDKAVRPTNVMGASKRLAEMVLQALAAQSADSLPAGAGAVSSGRTSFSMVRFGNVLGSSGSVVPLFRQQIRNGGPLTVTHRDVTRFFMTIPEAAQLVVQAGAMACGGEVFVLDMGQPVRIMDLARRMVELSGLTVRDAEHPAGDIEITVTGLRPGEKLYEELLIGDNPMPTDHSCIMKARESFLPWGELQRHLAQLQTLVATGDTLAVVRLLRDVVSGYVPPPGEWSEAREGGMQTPVSAASPFGAVATVLSLHRVA
jgi:FlaA1/EpsC-like NDP-sugar epimerase